MKIKSLWGLMALLAPTFIIPLTGCLPTEMYLKDKAPSVHLRGEGGVLCNNKAVCKARRIFLTVTNPIGIAREFRVTCIDRENPLIEKGIAVVRVSPMSDEQVSVLMLDPEVEHITCEITETK